MLRYRYKDDVSPSWDVKELVNLSDGRLLRRWKRGARITQPPEPRMRAFLPFHGLLAEWNPRYPQGVALADLGGKPYALLPLNGKGAVMRSLTIRDPQGDHSWDRIDYTEDRITLHVALDSGDLINSAPRADVIVDLARIPPPEETSLEHIEGTPGTNCCSYCCDGDGGGESGGSSGGRPLLGEDLQKLNFAKTKATSALNNIPSCSALFNDRIPNNGVSVINDTEYLDSEAGDTNCTGVAAYTRVGSYQVTICPDFTSNLSHDQRASRLIHEALHTAGLKELPQAGATMTSAEITAMVDEACNF